MNQRQISAAVALCLATALMAGCSSAEPEPVAPSTPAAASPPSPEASPSVTPPADYTGHEAVGMVATVQEELISPLDAPDGEPVIEMANPARPGVPLVFLVVGGEGDWLQVQLPMRPNGSTGWIQSSEVELASLSYALHVSTADRTVTLTRNGEQLEVFDAAIGTGDTPTPTGEYFITELLRPTNEGYGPYAFGISAFSEVLTSFGGGPGQIGLHGTPDESSIGQAASHGCIRLNNDDISRLAEILPLGTPITIV